MNIKIYRDIKQGSQEWDELRCGKITGSGVSDLMTDPRTKKAKENKELSQTAKTYLLQKVSENLIGYGRDSFDSKYFDWGHEHEPNARMYYEVRNAVIAEEVGFVEMSEYVGCSPDSLVGDDGGLEIKCPYNNDVHLKYLDIRTPDDLKATEKGYYWQVMFCLWVTGRQWWDFVSYDHRMTGKNRFHCIRIKRNEDEINDMAERVAAGVDFIQSKMIELV